jgi:hypothetical protein
LIQNDTFLPFTKKQQTVTSKTMTSFQDAWIDEKPTTGGWKKSLSTVKRRISGYTRNTKKFWVGFTSSGKNGCESRWNSKYKKEGMNRMVAIYETSSDDNAREVEKEVIEFYKEHCENENAGGGGSTGKPPYYVYVAFQE